MARVTVEHYRRCDWCDKYVRKGRIRRFLHALWCDYELEV